LQVLPQIPQMQVSSISVQPQMRMPLMQQQQQQEQRSRQWQQLQQLQAPTHMRVQWPLTGATSGTALLPHPSVHTPLV